MITFKRWGEALVFIVSTSAVGAHQYTYGGGIKKVQDVVQMYREGFPVKMPAELDALCSQVLKKVKIARVDKGSYKFFLVSGDEPFHWGSAESNSDVLVGLPWNFVYKSLNDIEVKDIRVFGDQIVNWDSKAGKQLLGTMVLSEREQKFAIAHQICMTNNHRRVTTPIIFSASVVFGFLVQGQFETNPKLKHLSPAVRSLGIVGGYVLGMINFIMLRNALNVYYQRESDIRASETDVEYYDGALDYYTKMLQRGKAYRSLMGEEGPKYFTPEGDERRPIWHYIFINQSLPYKKRIDNLSDHKNAHYTGEEDE